MMSALKKDFVEAALALLNSKLSDIHRELEELDQALENETKSSAGDKYETSREMIHQEQEKLTELQGNTKRMMDLLKNSSELNADIVQPGALVQTDKTLLHISVPLGKVESNGMTAFFVSPSSPLAQAMQGKHVKEEASFNGITHKIIEIV